MAVSVLYATFLKATEAGSSANPTTVTANWMADYDPNALILMARFAPTSFAIGGAPSFNGTEMTLVSSTWAGAQIRCDVYYHSGFTTGSKIISSPNTLATGCPIVAVAYKGVDLTNPFGSTNSTSGQSSAPAIALASAVTGGANGAGYVFGAMAHQDRAVAKSRNFTSVHESTGQTGGWNIAVQHGVPTSAVVSVSWTSSTIDFWAAVGLALNPAAQSYNLSPVAGNIVITVPTPPAFWQQHKVYGTGNIAVTCDAAPFSQEQSLTVPAVNIVVSGRVPVLASYQTLLLGPDDNWMVVSASDPVIKQAYGFAPVDGNIAVTCAPVDITQTHALSVTDGNLAVTCGAVPVIQTHNLDPSEIKYNGIRVTCGAVTLTQTHALSASDGLVTVSAGAVSLSGDYNIAPQAGNIAVTCGAVTLTQAYHLAVDGGYISPTVDAILIEQYHALSVSDGVVSVTAGVVRLGGLLSYVDDDRTLQSLTDQRSMVRARGHYYTLHNIDR